MRSSGYESLDVRTHRLLPLIEERLERTLDAMLHPQARRVVATTNGEDTSRRRLFCVVDLRRRRIVHESVVRLRSHRCKLRRSSQLWQCWLVPLSVEQ